MAPTFSALSISQELALYTSASDCDGVDIYQDRALLKSTISSRDNFVFANRLNHKSRSKSCFPNITSQPSFVVLHSNFTERSYRTWKSTGWKAEDENHHAKQQRTVTCQKSCSGLAAPATVVIVEDVDCSSDEEDLSSYETVCDNKLNHLENGNTTQGRGRPVARCGLLRGRPERFQRVDYEDSVSPFYLGSRTSSFSQASAAEPVGYTNDGRREGESRFWFVTFRYERYTV